MPELDARQLLADYRRATAHESTTLEASLDEASARLVSGEAVSVPESSSGASASGSGLTLKVLAAVGMVGAVALAGWALSGDRSEPTQVGAAPVEAAPADPVVAPATAPEEPPPTAETPATVAPPEQELEPEPAAEPSKRRRAKKKAPATAEAPNLDEEIRLMGEARRALSRGDAKKALSVLDEHKRRFPKGQLRSDREGSAITALCQLGREDAAQARSRTSGRAWRGCP